jgi:hypothetical protein
MPVYHAHKLAFIHIPKTAGSSIHHAIGPTDDFFSYEKDHVMGVCPQHFYLSELLQKCPRIEGYHRFTVVRNPYDRLISAFEYNRKFYWGKNLDFDSFVKKALSLDLRSRRFIFDGHLEKQKDYLDVQLPMSIFKYERLLSLLEYLAKLLDRSVYLNRYNQSERQNIGFYYKKLETIELVRNFYADDFEYFGYESSLSFSSSTK